MPRNFLRTKPHLSPESALSLRRCLTAFDVTFLGIGAIIGAGIFILTGIVAATKTGPGIVFSFLLAGGACACTALAYTELATCLGGCGSAYSYSYIGFGELIAWIIGWDLLLEYGISCPAVAIGWSGYLQSLLSILGIHIPHYLTAGPFEKGIINLFASFIVLMMTILLALGIKQSSRFNTIMVIIKLMVIFLFIGVAIPHFKTENWQVFLPFGWQGIISGAALIFFAYVGFDALSTTAEEVIKPQSSLPIGILVSLTICTLLYIVVSGLLTGIVHYSFLNTSSPVSTALVYLNHPRIAIIIAIGALASLTTVILVMYYGLTRIFFAMARDGLLPNKLAYLHPVTKTPIGIVLIVGFLMTLIAGVLPLHEAAELVNIGTLAAFVLVSAGVILLRYLRPDLPRPFKAPLFPLTPLLGILLSIYLMSSLSLLTWLRFIIWLGIGLIIYFNFGYQHSLLNKSNK